VAKGQEMAAFLAFPALGCLLLRVRVSEEPISQMSLMLLPTFPSCSQQTATGQGKEKKHLCAPESQTEQQQKSNACAGAE